MLGLLSKVFSGGLLSVLSGALKLGNILARMAERQRDVDSGMIRQSAKQMQEGLANVERAMEARRLARRSPVYLGGVQRGRDPNNRDEQ